MKLLIKNARIINEGKNFDGHILISDEKIEKIFVGLLPNDFSTHNLEIIDASGLLLIPGVIDDQVHFREPGLTWKGDIESESRAAVAGGVTSFMDMPNTYPQTTTQALLEDKYTRAAMVSSANFSFYMGATNSNLSEVLKTNPENVCGIKIFMGSSTGNMLVDNEQTLSEIFRFAPTIIAVHCEDESIILKNMEMARVKFCENVPFSFHPVIRNTEACYVSSAKAVELALRHHTRLHLLHISTAKEMELFSSENIENKKITAEVCVHHLWFDDEDYTKYGSLIKWNPAIKSRDDREALRAAILSKKIDVVASDHAPHTIEEKSKSYFETPSGGPLVQHTLVAMLDLCRQGVFKIDDVVDKMCHAPAQLFGIEKRGFIREGYWADLVLIDPQKSWKVEKTNILYKCGWSPFEGTVFHNWVSHTFVNGNLVYCNGEFVSKAKGKRLLFNR